MLRVKGLRKNAAVQMHEEYQAIIAWFTSTRAPVSSLQTSASQAQPSSIFGPAISPPAAQPPASLPSSFSHPAKPSSICCPAISHSVPANCMGPLVHILLAPRHWQYPFSANPRNGGPAIQSERGWEYNFFLLSSLYFRFVMAGPFSPSLPHCNRRPTTCVAKS